MKCYRSVAGFFGLAVPRFIYICLLVVTLSLLALAQKQGPPPSPTPARTELNLQGQTDSTSGAARRNENVQFNPIDNNALKDANLRLGTTATIFGEFKAEQNYFGGEFGKAVAPVLHAAPPGKPANLHGNVFEWHNNSVLSARSFFQVGPVQPARTNDYGFQLSLPVFKLGFFTIDGNQQFNHGNVNGNVLVPKANERTPLATDPQIRRIVARFLAAYGNQLPNRTDTNERGLNTNSPQLIDTNAAAIRFDAPRAKERLSAVYRFTGQTVDAFEFIQGQNPDTDTKSHSARLTWSRKLWGGAQLEATSGFDRLRTLIVPEPNAVGPQVQISTIETLGPGSNVPIDRAQNVFRNGAQLAWVSGKHTWKLGGELLRRQINGSEYSSQRGVIQFQNDFGRDALTNFLLGIPSRYSIGVGDPHRGFRNLESQLYLGDEYKALGSLTVQYGVRYQTVGQISEVNRLSQVPYGCQCKNVAPRMGLAWRLPGRAGVLRAGYGLHFGEVFPVTFQQIRWNPPGMIKAELHNPDLANPLRDLDTSPGARSTVFVLPPNLATPYSNQYNFTWEPEVGKLLRLQLGYVGSRSPHLFYLAYDNRARIVPGVPQTNETVNDRRPDKNYFDVRTVTNGSFGYFDAARVSLVLPRWHGMTSDAAYWWSKAIDLGGNYYNTASNSDTSQVRSQWESGIHQDLKGPSSFDQRHALLLRASYELRNWRLSIVGLAKTGTPFDVITGSDGLGFGNVDGSTGDRPNILDPSILGRKINNPGTSKNMLPRSAFSYIAPGTYRGNLGRNVFRKDGIRNLNASLERMWKLPHLLLLTFRAESINFFNTPQFAEPSFQLTSPSFGQITNTLNDGRTFRFLLRLGW